MTSRTIPFPTRSVCNPPVDVASPAGAVVPPPSPAAPAGPLTIEGRTPFRAIHADKAPSTIVDADGHTMLFHRREAADAVAQEINARRGDRPWRTRRKDTHFSEAVCAAGFPHVEDTHTEIDRIVQAVNGEEQ